MALLDLRDFDLGEGLAVAAALLVPDLVLILHDRYLFCAAMFHDFPADGGERRGAYFYLGAVFFGTQKNFNCDGVTGFSRQCFYL